MRHATTWIMLGALCASGCSGLSYSVSNSVFRDMSVDKKMRLFDAENDVSIAEDDREQMRQRVHEIREEISVAHRQQWAAEDMSDPRLARQTQAMWQRRIDYLELSIDYIHSRMAIQSSVVLVSQAKFELAKALLVKKIKLDGAESIQIKDFESQVSNVTRRSKTELAELDKTKPRLERARLEWLKMRDEVAASTLSGAGTPGEDELPVWESW